MSAVFKVKARKAKEEGNLFKEAAKLVVSSEEARLTAKSRACSIL